MKQLELIRIRRSKRRKKRLGNTKRRSRVPHRFRPEHQSRDPVLVTLRLRRDVPSLRSQTIVDLLRRIFTVPRMPAFQAVHYSVQSDHVHLIVEADDKTKLSSGLRSLIIRIALRLNRMLGRKGRVFDDRYHRRDLPTPTEVRNALRYVLANFKKHGLAPATMQAHDAFSTSPAFGGWDGVRLADLAHAAFDRFRPRRPWTWLLRVGWLRGGGPLLLHEAPAGSAPFRAEALPPVPMF